MICLWKSEKKIAWNYFFIYLPIHSSYSQLTLLFKISIKTCNVEKCCFNLSVWRYIQYDAIAHRKIRLISVHSTSPIVTYGTYAGSHACAVALNNSKVAYIRREKNHSKLIGCSTLHKYIKQIISNDANK